MAESFSSTGDVARQSPNQADSMHRPHPLTPAMGPSYDKDQYEVPFTVEGEIISPEICRELEY